MKFLVFLISYPFSKVYPCCLACCQADSETLPHLPSTPYLPKSKLLAINSSYTFLGFVLIKDLSALFSFSA
jgi:hypothetical protein